MADRGIQLQDKGDKLYPVTTTSNVYTPNNISVDEYIRKIDNLYPAGSIYLSVNNVSPASLFGGTWEALEEGYALWTTTTSGQGGNTISAGLPNITGMFRFAVPGKSYLIAEETGGAFNGYNSQSCTVPGGSGSVHGNAYVNFDANNGASTKGIYGNSSTVQPPAVKLYAWKRIS